MRQINAWIREQTRTSPRSHSSTPEPPWQTRAIPIAWLSPPTASIRPRGYRAMADAIRPVLQGALRGIL